MAHAIWSGAINFGLVTIPVKLFTAVRSNDLRFNFLHKKDDGRIFNERHCTVCGEKVEYADLVRGYEYEKGHYVVLSDEDLKSVNPEATQSVDIVEFVDLGQIDPMYFDTPYYLEPEKKGRHAYALLRESLREANKVGIARVVIRSREHLAALKPNGEALVLELMHYADELVEQSSFDFPELKENVAPAELKVAKLLIDSMSSETFEPEKFRDQYREDVMAMIDARAAGQSVDAPAAKRSAPTNVVNLMDVLQRSLEQSRGGASGAKPAEAAPARKKSASAAKPKRKKSAA
jgi:DNA end-binding protein Ku